MWAERIFRVQDLTFKKEDVVKFTKAQLYEFLSNQAERLNNLQTEDGTYKEYLESTSSRKVLTAKEFEALKALDFEVICCDFSMSENHIGGDDIISFLDKTLDVCRDNANTHQVITWYGDDTEVLIVGVPIEELDNLID